jgi:HD-GYP domain-containing protein (c-di-GMP phosphodiesterase class II)
MLKLPEALLQKPGPLTPEEILQVRKHVDLGAEKIQESGLSAEVGGDRGPAPRARGWQRIPAGPQGSEMKVIGACAGIVDTFGAMTTKRPYADAISPSNVLGIMHKWKDKIFNGWLIEEFIRCIGVFPSAA